MFKRRHKLALVLGCGPAGLFAAHALRQNGWEVSIFSKKRPSELFGAQYLHAPIPGLTDGQEPIKVNYSLAGTVASYREKVYGPNRVTTSVETLEATHEAWDIRAAYSKAYAEVEDRIWDTEITPEWMDEQRQDPIWDAIVSSIPAKTLCVNEDHKFLSQLVWAMGDAPARGQYTPFAPPAATILCDGTPDKGWYRAANVFGHSTIEWPAQTKPPLPGVAKVEKPIGTDCTCWTGPKFLRVGRYGRWQKSVLSHHAYTQAAQL